MTIMTLVVVTVALALIFDFVNGFHDAANAISTIVVTRTLTPLQAVLLAGAANFVGYFAFGLAVANTIGTKVVHVEQMTLGVILAALVGAVAWNIFTWLLGLPTSSSHALIGGLVGATLAAAGIGAVKWGGVGYIFAFIFVAPLLGFLGAQIFTTGIIWMFRRSTPAKATKVFKVLQLFSAATASIGHGTNDAQKTMGIIALALFTGGITQEFRVDHWVVFSAYAAISLGTCFGGWRIVKTMGTNITKIRQMEGFCSNVAASLVLMGTSHAGIPVSTTHVIAGSIMGVGSVEHARQVRWITARRIVWAWFLTIPCSAAVAAAACLLIVRVFGVKL